MPVVSAVSKQNPFKQGPTLSLPQGPISQNSPEYWSGQRHRWLVDRKVGAYELRVLESSEVLDVNSQIPWF